jgi:shikimate dehydrogenase
VLRRQCAVVGRPVEHSLSPLLHRTAYEALGLDWEYSAIDLGPEQLGGFVAGRTPDWRGLSVTMPLKEAAFAVAERVDEPGALVHAVNTLVRAADGAWTGANTDVPGLVAAWRAAGVGEATTATILGAGATARSAVLAMSGLGVRSIRVLVREPVRARDLVALVRGLGVTADVGLLEPAEQTPIPSVDLLVSTVPAAAQAGWATAHARVARVVTDVVYDPPVTPLLAAAASLGRVVVDGFDLLVQQAALQVELMTGRPAPLDQMRATGRAALRRRTGSR